MMRDSGGVTSDPTMNASAHGNVNSPAHEYDPALAIKFTIRRERPSGSPGERDVFGAQQYAPLFDLPIPVGS